MSTVAEIIAIWFLISVLAFDTIFVSNLFIKADKKSIIKTVTIVEIVSLLSSIFACVVI